VKFHPSAQIITWCILVAILQTLSLELLMIFSCLILLLSMWLSGKKLMQLLRRTRWIMFSLLIVYAYTIPGQPLLEELGMFSPGREGLNEGFLQLVRLFIALAGLAILLDRLDRDHLISGLYTLLIPLSWMGMSRERVAVRLALTLHYAETAMMNKKDNWQSGLKGLFETQVSDTHPIELKLYRFGLGDCVLVILAIALLVESLR